MPVPSALELLAGLRRTLVQEGIEVERIVESFGQVPASLAREEGHRFPLNEHVRGLLLSQLSNQRPWRPIAANLAQIREVFLEYDADALQQADPASLIEGLRKLRCGNRSVAKQMLHLGANIRTLLRIEREQNSLDAFVTSSDASTVARRLSQPGPYKLQQVGFTLALEYLRNVGIRAGKPDLHVRRCLSGERLAYADGYPSEEAAYRLVATLAHEANCNPTYLDNLLWLFCAQDYGNVCRAAPRCPVCAFRDICNYPRRGEASGDKEASSVE